MFAARVGGMVLIIQQTLNGIALGAIYVLVSVGFALTFGTLQVINLAQGATLMLGSFMGLLCVIVLHLPLLLAFVIAALVAGVVGGFTEMIIIRPLGRGRLAAIGEFPPLVATLAFATILEAVVEIVSGASSYAYPPQAWFFRTYNISGVSVSRIQVLSIVLAIGASMTLLLVLSRAKVGFRIRAAAEDPVAVGLLGVAAGPLRLLVFMISGALAGLGGVLVGVSFGSVSFGMGDSYLLVAFVVIAVGGLGSLGGSIVVGFGIGIIQALVEAYVGMVASQLVVYSMLFIVLIVKPSGLFGKIPVGAQGERR